MPGAARFWPGVMLFGIPARRRSWLAMLGILLLVAFGSVVLACGHSSTTVCNALSISGTTAGTYTVTVTGTSGATTATDAVTLTCSNRDRRDGQKPICLEQRSGVFCWCAEVNP